ncbi:uncharacterized protein MELLADRAFT_111133 [Melampsora larici-populina 98AG31]|uniref:Secreted protein n=1 Tax=Melampsora larici-populina (strain 98AG31 / pathotype 3-4-7) TaxID=747676 RepID=F4S249_MELLP|nr:uncharacterized protein MELLADRAFT_111133 [Melampsora larici-populina 98AG31]EGG01322.1 secreted protein [Melampsora larici-populina 98AG31]
MQGLIKTLVLFAAFTYSVSATCKDRLEADQCEKALGKFPMDPKGVFIPGSNYYEASCGTCVAQGTSNIDSSSKGMISALKQILAGEENGCNPLIIMLDGKVGLIFSIIQGKGVAIVNP